MKALTEQTLNIDPALTAFHLSSGLDSSILAILASRTFGKNKIQTVSFIAKGKGLFKLALIKFQKFHQKLERMKN